MQTLEAVISLMVLISIFSYIIPDSYNQPSLDDSLYRYQLVNDIWRVVYLKGDLQNLSMASGNPVHEQLTRDLDEIHRITGLCTYIGGGRASSCTGIAEYMTVGSARKSVFIDGIQTTVTLTVAKPAT